MIVVRFVLLLEATLAAQSDDVVLKREIKILAFHARQFGLDHDLILVLVDVNGRIPGPARDAFVVAEGAGNIGGKQTIDLILKTA